MPVHAKDARLDAAGCGERKVETLTREQLEFRNKQDEIVRNKLAVPPLRFEANGKEMMYCYPDSNHELAGWILYRHPDGQWVTLRKATDRDICAMSEAVSRSFHDSY